MINRHLAQLLLGLLAGRYTIWVYSPPSRLTQPSPLCGMLKWASAFGLSNNKWWWWMWLPSSLQAGQWLKSVGFVQRSAALWHCSAFMSWTGRTLTMTLSQHHKHCPSYYYASEQWNISESKFLLFRSAILKSLLILFFFLLGQPLQQKCKAPLFQIVWGRNLSEMFFIVHTLIDRVRFSTWCHTIKMAAMTSFHTEKCCRLVSTYAAASASSWSIVWYIRTRWVVTWSCPKMDLKMVALWRVKICTGRNVSKKAEQACIKRWRWWHWSGDYRQQYWHSSRLISLILFTVTFSK